jgi:hypothetical protein
MLPTEKNEALWYDWFGAYLVFFDRLENSFSFHGATDDSTASYYKRRC